MFLFYVDECGDSSLESRPGEAIGTLKHGVSPYFTLAAVGIRDSSRKPLADALFEIKQRHFGSAVETGEWGATELKGSYLNRLVTTLQRGVISTKPSGYGIIKTQAVADNLISDLGLVFEKFRPMTFSITVDKRRLLLTREEKVHDPVSVAYGLLHERVAFLLDKLFAGESAIFIADQQAQHEKRFREGELNRVRRELVSKLAVQPDFNLIVDKPLWVDTALSSWDRELIQLADIVAYAANRCVESGTAPQEPHLLWKQIHRAMAVHWRYGTVAQAGFTVFPRSREFYPDLGDAKNRH